MSLFVLKPNRLLGTECYFRQVPSELLRSHSEHVSNHTGIRRVGVNRLNSVRFFSRTPRDPPGSTYLYRAAAAFCGKGNPFAREKDRFVFRDSGRTTADSTDERSLDSKGSREKLNTGQDAFFISRVGGSPDIAFGVADGVGGWSEVGVDPGDVSRALCNHMQQGAMAFPYWSRQKQLMPLDLLKLGYHHVLEQQSIIAGGTTACLAVAHQSGHVEVANFGDSGFVQLRKGTLHHESRSQTHGFNTPYQLSVFPRVNGHRPSNYKNYLADKPDKADISLLEVQHGDVLVFATDGVWDNLSPKQVLAVTNHVMKTTFAWGYQTGNCLIGQKLPYLTYAQHKNDPLQALIARDVVLEARAGSMNKNRDSPFALKMREQFGNKAWRGGKVDDICVVVAIVVRDQSPPGRPGDEPGQVRIPDSPTVEDMVRRR